MFYIATSGYYALRHGGVLMQNIRMYLILEKRGKSHRIILFMLGDITKPDCLE